MGEVPEKSELDIIVDAGIAAGELTPQLAAQIREITEDQRRNVGYVWTEIFRFLTWHDGHEAAFQFVAGELVRIAAVTLRGIKAEVGEEVSPDSFAKRCQLTAQDVLGNPIDAQFFSEVFDPPPFLPSMGVRQLKPALESLIAEFLSSQPAPVNRETIVAAVASRYAEAYPEFSPDVEYNCNGAINRLHGKRIVKRHYVPYSREEPLFSLEPGAQVPAVEPDTQSALGPGRSLEPARQLVPEEEIGEGKEIVYVYFNEAERSLAKYEGRDWWPCKVGFTKSSLSERLMAQTPHTGIGRLPVVGLVIKTSDGYALERALHFALENAATRMGDAMGKEWFETAPAKIKDWYLTYHAAAAVLRRAPTD